MENWSILGNNHLHKIAQPNIIINVNFDKQEMLPMLQIMPKFHQETVSSYAKCNKTKLVMGKQKLLEEQPWVNCHISIYIKKTSKHRILNYKHWQQSGLVFAKDIKMTDAKIDENFIFFK